MRELITIRGDVEEVIFHNPENGYIVFTLDVEDEFVPVFGNLGQVIEGESLVVAGGYVTSAKYGRQFKAEFCERFMPTTLSGIRKYLGSGIVKGLGPAMAKKIVQAFGEDSLYVVENESHRLSSIKGISPAKAQQIGEEFKRLNSVREVISYLSRYEISPITAVAAWRSFGDDTVSIIRTNPYSLCESGIDLHFEVADKIAYELGYEYNNINRVKAGIIYVLRENANAGHTCLPIEKLAECVCGTLGVSKGEFHHGLEKGVNEGDLIFGEIKGREFVYLKELYNAESYVSGRLSIMIKTNVSGISDYSDEIKGIEWSENIQYEALQKKAISGCMANNVFILTGGPGTGKTTTLNAVILLCRQRKIKISLCAPTGRAAQRLSELTGFKAQTIHRLLVVDFTKENELAFKHNEKNPLKTDVVIVDEMSMVDIQLMESLLKALPEKCKLIMVGDFNQLPSVGAGNVLKDLMSSKLIPYVELKEIFRQAAQSLIVTNAHKIVRGEIPDLDHRKNDFFFMNMQSDFDTVKTVIDLCKNRLPKTYDYSPMVDIQVLSPTKMGEAGTKELNKALQFALNPPSGEKSQIKYFDVLFRLGDKVMQTKNDYDIEWQKGAEKGMGIYNGDIGFIVEVGKNRDFLKVDFDGKIAVYTTDMISKLEHAYAVTVHKSQGSEYNAVIIPLPSYSKKLMYRSLLYTAVTRAKKILIIIGQKGKVIEMVNNNRKTVRYSLLRQMIEGNFENSNDETKTIQG